MSPLKIIGSDFTATMHIFLHFSQTPNFTTLDSNGRPQDSFQIFFAFNPATPNPANPAAVDVLNRGDEIHIAHAIRIRDARPPVADPKRGVGRSSWECTLSRQNSAKRHGRPYLQRSLSSARYCGSVRMGSGDL
jgi:hypothetical protein